MDNPLVDRIAGEADGATGGVESLGMIGFDIGIAGDADRQRFMAAAKPGKVMRFDASHREYPPSVGERRMGMPGKGSIQSNEVGGMGVVPLECLGRNPWGETGLE